MTRHLERAPLIELIIELRWGQALHIQGPASHIGFIQHETHTRSSPDDALFNAFADRCATIGLTRSERLVPPGFPTVPGQVAYRFKGSQHGNNLVQIGPGVLTINALPPSYQSWQAFRTFLELALNCLAQSAQEGSTNIKIGLVSVRTINAFGSDILKAHSPQELKQILGFNVSLPEELSRVVSAKSESQLTIQQNFMLPDGRRIFFTLSDGQANASPAVIFDISVATQTPMCTPMETAQSIEDAHDLLSRNFALMTEPLSELLGAKEI